MAAVSLHNLSKTYAGGVQAVRDLDLQVRQGELMVLVGPSGCGKTTVLRLIAGLEDIDIGEVRIGAETVNRLPPCERDVAMVFQEPAVFPHLSVHDNLAFSLKLRQAPPDEVERRVAEAAEVLGLTPCLSRQPGTLSGGQRQRVALGRALVRQPQVFLFDEPLSSLDAALRLELRTEIGRLHRRLGATIIHVTHDQLEAMTMGDRIAVMRDGVLQQVATPMQLYQQPANRFVATFVGSPPMNIFDGRLAEADGALEFVSAAFRTRLPQAWRGLVARQAVSLGLRPADIGPAPAGPSEIVRLSARIDDVEPLGPQTNLYLSTPQASFVAHLGASGSYRAGAELEVAFDPAKAHLFDGHGASIARRSDAPQEEQQ